MCITEGGGDSGGDVSGLCNGCAVVGEGWKGLRSQSLKGSNNNRNNRIENFSPTLKGSYNNRYNNYNIISDPEGVEH